MTPTACFAVLTPPGRGGIAVLRCSGHGAARAVETLFRGRLPEAGRLAYGHVVDDQGRPLDEVILYRAADETFEINGHGGPAAVEALAGRLEAAGLRRADPDALAAREGIGPVARDALHRLPRTRTTLAARILLDQLNGALERAIQGAADVAAVEALLDRWRTCGRFLARPPVIAVAGPPNAGKSTLVNRLVGADRVLTHPAPGTTRDAVEAEASLGGLPVVLVDTAGLRDAVDEIERLGIERAESRIAEADLVLYLIDAASGPDLSDARALAALGPRALPLAAKSDLAPPPAGYQPVSAATGDGIDALIEAIRHRLAFAPPPPGTAVPFTESQAAALRAARAAFTEDDAGRA